MSNTQTPLSEDSELRAPIVGHSLLMKALKDKNPELLAQWLSLKPDLNDNRLARPRYNWSFPGQQEMAIDAGQALSGAWPLLHQAIGDGSDPNLRMTRMLLEAGADPAQHVHALGNRVAEQVAMVPYNSMQMLKLVIEFGVDVIKPSSSGHSPIMVAARLADVEMMEFLASTGADVLAKDDKQVGLLVLGLEHPEVCEWMLRRCPDEVNAFHVNSFGKSVTCLMQAVDCGYTDSVHVLMAHGADPNLKNPEGLSAYDHAEMMARTEIIEWMRAFESAHRAKSVIASTRLMASMGGKTAPRTA